MHLQSFGLLLIELPKLNFALTISILMLTFGMFVQNVESGHKKFMSVVLFCNFTTLIITITQQTIAGQMLGVLPD